MRTHIEDNHKNVIENLATDIFDDEFHQDFPLNVLGLPPQEAQH